MDRSAPLTSPDRSHVLARTIAVALITRPAFMLSDEALGFICLAVLLQGVAAACGPKAVAQKP